MRVSVVAGLILGVHVAVIGSVVMTQGCASTRSGADSTVPAMVEPAPMPVLPPSADLVSQPVPVQPVAFPQIQPPAEPAPLKTSVAAGNIYVVKSGDSLSKIAAAHGVTTRELAELNQITDANKIRANQKLVLPDHAKPSQSQPSEKSTAAPAKASASAPAATASGDAYVVKAGDALSKIAALHGVKTKDLMAANNITDANKIRVGQKLAIPGAKAAPAKTETASAPEAKPAEAAKVEETPAAPAVAPLPAPVPEAPAAPAADVSAPAPDPNQEAMLDYTVQEGDTAEGIARLFVVRKDDILRVNNVPSGSDVQPGQKIKIPPSSL